MTLNTTDRRCIAYLVDAAIVVWPLAIVASFALPGGEAAFLVFLAFSWLVLLAYFALGDAVGATPGKRLLGLRVVDERTGAPIGLARALKRRVAHLLGGILFLAGWLIGLADPERRTAHDRIAGSVVQSSASHASSL